MTQTTATQIEEQLAQAKNIDNIYKRYRILKACLTDTILRDENIPLQIKCGQSFFDLALETFNAQKNLLLQRIFSTLEDSGINTQATAIFDQHMILGYKLRNTVTTPSSLTTNESVNDDDTQFIATADFALHRFDYATALSAIEECNLITPPADNEALTSIAANQFVDYLRIKMCAEIGLLKLKDAKKTHGQLFKALNNEGATISDEAKHTYIAAYKILQASPFTNKAYPLISPNTNPNQPNIVAKYFPHIPLVFSCVYHYSAGECELFSTYMNSIPRAGIEIELAFNLTLEALEQKTQQHIHSLKHKGITAPRIQQATK
jgi:hypothetical protein